MSSATAWSLPTGATPWPESIKASGVLAPGGGYRSPAFEPGLTWYREAHDDYIQVLVETGVPGLLLALWAAAASLRASRHDPWTFLAVLGLLIHELVDFDLQIPAIVMLFVTLVAVPRKTPAAGGL